MTLSKSYEYPSTIRPLAKLAYAEEFEGDAERRTAAYLSVREDSSTASTSKLPAEVEFCKRSIGGANSSKQKSILVVGLGNIGKEYQNTRHNVGFIAVDYLSEYHKISWNTKSKFHAELAQGVYSNDLKNWNVKQGVSERNVQLIREYANAPKFCGANSLNHLSIIDGHKLLLAKPLTYMNLSGRAVQAICSYYNIKTPNIFVVHDDIDLPIGRIKYKLAGSSGGHNGLKSLDQHVGNDYHRIRIGVGRPAAYDDVSDYVLAAFSKEEYKIIISSIEIITNNFHLLLSGKVEEFNKSVV